MDEIIDVIDEQDKVIRQEKSSIIHRENLLHRYAHVIIIKSDNRIVVQQRHHNMKNYPNTFDASVGEHVSSGETYYDAAMRGLEEEIGIKTQIKFLAKIENRIQPEIENMLGELFIGHYDGPYHPQDNEISRLEFMTISELSFILERYPYLICDNFKPAIEAYKKSL